MNHVYESYTKIEDSNENQANDSGEISLPDHEDDVLILLRPRFFGKTKSLISYAIDSHCCFTATVFQRKKISQLALDPGGEDTSPEKKKQLMKKRSIRKFVPHLVSLGKDALDWNHRRNFYWKVNC